MARPKLISNLILVGLMNLGLMISPLLQAQTDGTPDLVDKEINSITQTEKSFLATLSGGFKKGRVESIPEFARPFCV